MDPPLQARIDALAKELIQLAHRSGETIFIAAGLDGSRDTDAVLIVTTDPPRARQLEGAFTEASRKWEKTRESVYDAKGAPASPVSRGEPPDEGDGVLGLN